MKENKNVFRMTMISMFLAILIIQTFIPVLGYIPLGPIDVTIVHITVILAGILFGSKTGLVVGTSWGLLSMIRAYIQPTPFNVVFLNPLISVLPRLLVGWLSGLLFEAIKNRLSGRWSYVITAFVGTILNTFLVLGGIYLFAAETYAAALGISQTALLGALAAVIATNGVIEVVASMIILPLVAIPVARVLKNRRKQ